MEHNKTEFILNNKKCFDVLMSFWNLFEKNIQSKILIADLSRLYASVFVLFKFPLSLYQVRTYLYEHLYAIEKIQHEELISKNTNNVSRLTMGNLIYPKNNIKHKSEKIEVDELENRFQSVTFNQFGRIFICFFDWLTCDTIASHFVVFWEYVHVHVVLCASNEVKCEVSLQERAVEESDKKRIIVYASEQVQIDKSQVYEKYARLGCKKSIIDTSKVISIGNRTKNYLQELIDCKFAAASQNWLRMKNYMSQNVPIYLFYCISNNDEIIRLNPAVYDKFLYEEVRVVGSTIKKWKNLFSESDFFEIDHISRINTLTTAKKNPYYYKEFNKLPFEEMNADFHEVLMRGNIERLSPSKKANDVKKNDPGTKVKNAEVNEVFDCEMNGVEIKINKNRIEFDTIWDNRTTYTHYNNLLELAKEKQLRILLIGKKNSGKSKIGEILGRVLNIKFINIDTLISEEIKRISEIEQSEETRESSSELERLMMGESVSTVFIVDVVKREMQSVRESGQGFIFEFSSILENRNMLDMILAMNEDDHYINHIINLKLSESSVKLRRIEYREIEKSEEVENHMYLSKSKLKEIEAGSKRAEYMKSGSMSESESELIMNLKEKLESVVPLKDTFKYRDTLSNDQSADDIKSVNELNEFVRKRAPKYTGIQIDGMSTREIIKSILCKFEFKRRDSPTEIENCSEIESILSSGRNLSEYEVRREWSFYKNVDCVEYIEKNVVQLGLAEYAINFSNCAFLFANEVNKDKFARNPFKYIGQVPRLTGHFNVLIVCPDNVEIKEVVVRIAKQQSLKMIDMSEYILAKLEEIERLKEEAFKGLSSMFEGVSVGFSEIFKGAYLNELIPSLDLIKLFMLENGVKLEVRFDAEEELKTMSEKADPKSKKKPVAKPIKSCGVSSLVSNATNVSLMNDFYSKLLESEPSEEIMRQIPTLPILTTSSAAINGFLFYNWPIDAEIAEFLSTLPLDFYKVISYLGKSEFENSPTDYSVERAISENPEWTISENSTFTLEYSSEGIKLAEQQIKDLIDPFKDQIDSEQLRVNYEFESEEVDKELLKFGVFGRVCPVSLIDNNWLIECDPRNFSLQINGHLYCFASENNMQSFRHHYESYIHKLSTVNKVLSRVFVAGSIGSGLNSICDEIEKQKGFKIFDLKRHLLSLKKEYMLDKMRLKVLREGFKGNIIGDDAKLLENFEQENDDEQFEERVFREAMMSSENRVIKINTCFSDDERAIFKSDIKEMMVKFALIPDHLIVLKCGEYMAQQRILKREDKIAELKKQLEKIKISNEQKIKEKEKRLELNEDNEENEIEFETEIVIEDEIEKMENEIKKRREKENEAVDELIETLKETSCRVTQINTEVKWIKVISSVQQFIDEVEKRRVNCMSNANLHFIKDSTDNEEMSVEAKLKKLISTGVYRMSKYGLRNCANPKRFVTSLTYNVIRDNKIYFFETEEELKSALNNPESINESAKRDKKPIVFMLHKVFDKQLKAKMKSEFKFAFVSLKKAIKYAFSNSNARDFSKFSFADFDIEFEQISVADLMIPDLCEVKNAEINDYPLNVIQRKLVTNERLTNHEKVYMVVFYSKIVNKQGVVFENFPENIEQFSLLNAAKIVPNIVFTTNYDESTYRQNMPSFFQNDEIIVNLLSSQISEKRSLEQFIDFNFSALYTLNKNKSTESNFEMIKQLIDNYLDSFSTAMTRKANNRPYSLNKLAVSRAYIEKNLTSLGLMSLYELATRDSNQVVQFDYSEMTVIKNCIFADARMNLISSLAEIKVSNNPKRQKEVPTIEMSNMNRPSNQRIEKQSKFKSICSICHAKKEAKRGRESMCLNYKDSLYYFCSLIHLHQFYQYPNVYSVQNVDVKLIEQIELKPVQIEKESQIINELTVAMSYICKLKLKHPGLSIKETAINLLAIFMKYRNLNKDEHYRRKYELKMNKFISNCEEMKQINSELNMRNKSVNEGYKGYLVDRISEFLAMMESIKEKGIQNYLRQYIT